LLEFSGLNLSQTDAFATLGFIMRLRKHFPECEFQVLSGWMASSGHLPEASLAEAAGAGGKKNGKDLNNR
jgi:hypothetical protein